jgi:hypothetical protein
VNFLQYPPLLPSQLERDDAMYIAGVFADETRAVLHAETFIAERRYRQMLMAAQAYKLVFLKTRRRYERALEDSGWLLKYAEDTTGPASNPDWATPSGLAGDSLRKPAGNTGSSYHQIAC